MTETNPLGTLSRVKRHMQGWSRERRLEARAKQGYAVPFVDTRHVDDTGRVLAWDGKSLGELEVRGPWVAGRYYDNDEQQDRFTPDGWFKTGDHRSHRRGGLRAHRRPGEGRDQVPAANGSAAWSWKNALMAHPLVREAAVFAGRHPKWGRAAAGGGRAQGGRNAGEGRIDALFGAKFAKFWLPDDYLFLDELPKTSVASSRSRPCARSTAICCWGSAMPLSGGRSAVGRGYRASCAGLRRGGASLRKKRRLRPSLRGRPGLTSMPMKLRAKSGPSM